MATDVYNGSIDAILLITVKLYLLQLLKHWLYDAVSETIARGSDFTVGYILSCTGTYSVVCNPVSFLLPSQISHYVFDKTNVAGCRAEETCL